MAPLSHSLWLAVWWQNLSHAADTGQPRTPSTVDERKEKNRLWQSIAVQQIGQYTNHVLSVIVKKKQNSKNVCMVCNVLLCSVRLFNLKNTYTGHWTIGQAFPL